MLALVAFHLYSPKDPERSQPSAADVSPSLNHQASPSARENDPREQEQSVASGEELFAGRLLPGSAFAKVGENQTAPEKENTKGYIPPLKFSSASAAAMKPENYQDLRSRPAAQAYEGRAAAVLAARSVAQALKSYQQRSGQHAVAANSNDPEQVFYRGLQSGSRQFVARAAEEAVALQALKAGGEATAADEKSAQRNIKAAAAEAVVSSGLASARASGIAPLANLELELLPSDETGWGISASTLIPLWESEEKNHTAFTQLSYRHDNEEFVTPEGGRSLITDTVASAGFAYRNYRQDRNYLWGVNTFFDTDTDKHWRNSVGMDVDWGTFSMSGNYYYALTGWENTVDGFEAKIRDGYDVEARGRLKPLDGAELGLKAFTWLGEDGADDINGLQVSAHYQPISLIGLNGSYSFNNGDLPLWEAGVSFTYLLGVPFIRQTQHLTYAERVDLRNLRHRKVRRENRLYLQERVKAANSVSVASLKGSMAVANTRGASAVQENERFAFPALVSLSAGTADVAALSFNDGAILAMGAGSQVDVSAGNVALVRDGFIRYKSGGVHRNLSMPEGISIRLLGTEVEIRRQGGESTVGVLSGSVVITGPGYSISAKAADIVDVRTGKKLIAFTDRFRHISASLAMIDGPNLRSSVWNGDDLDGNGLSYETEHQLEDRHAGDNPQIEVRLSFSGSAMVDLGSDGVTHFFRTAENQRSTVMVEAGLFADGIPVNLVEDVTVSLVYFGTAAADDVQGRRTNLTIPAHRHSQSFTMQIADDNAAEGTEEMHVKLAETAPSLAVGGQALQLSIFDNDDEFTGPEAHGCACGLPDSVDAGSSVTLDGTGSEAKHGRTITAYHWEQVSGPAVNLLSAETATPQFTAPAVTCETAIAFRLTVTDSFGLSGSTVVNVTVVPEN